MINIRKDGSRNVPYISYYHNSFTKSKNCVRVAWQINSTLSGGTDDGDKFTGAWEVMTVPAASTPVPGEFICNGVPSTTWTSANRPDTNWPSDISKSILIGYFTNTQYEGAVIKSDMTVKPSIFK
jgi:hypothetical protein